MIVHITPTPQHNTLPSSGSRREDPVILDDSEDTEPICSYHYNNWDRVCPNCEAYKPPRSFARTTRSGELEETKWCRNCREDTARKTVYSKAVRGVKQLKKEVEFMDWAKFVKHALEGYSASILCPDY